MLVALIFLSNLNVKTEAVNEGMLDKWEGFLSSTFCFNRTLKEDQDCI